MTGEFYRASYCIRVGDRDWIGYILQATPHGWRTVVTKSFASAGDAEIGLARLHEPHRWCGELDVRAALASFPPAIRIDP